MKYNEFALTQPECYVEQNPQSLRWGIYFKPTGKKMAEYLSEAEARIAFEQME